jgi:hypothetical protein
MPSTDPALAVPLRRAHIAGFWILTTAVVSAVVVLICWALGASLWPAASALLLPVPALFWPRWLEIGVIAWNRGARLAAASLRAYALKVSYYVVFRAVGWTGPRLRLGFEPHDRSRWIQHAVGSKEAGRGDAGGHGLLAFAGQPGNAWTVCLLPVLALLSVLRDDAKDGAPPPNTYTLY